MQDVSLEKLIESGAHFGHHTRRWNPKMKPYIYGEMEGVHVFDLTTTKTYLEEALEFLKNTTKEGKSVLFLGTKKQAKEKIREVAKLTDSFYVNERWLGGILTNFEQIKKSSEKLTKMEEKMKNGGYNDRTKKERVLIEREIERLRRFFDGLVGMEKIPDVLFIVDTKREKSAVKEANIKGVKVIGIIDTNADPYGIDYPIPMNDDATRAVEYVLELAGEAIMDGKKKPAKKTSSKKTKKSSIKKKSQKKTQKVSKKK